MEKKIEVGDLIRLEIDYIWDVPIDSVGVIVEITPDEIQIHGRVFVTESYLVRFFTGKIKKVYDFECSVAKNETR